jgi:hypothetical protein
MMFVPLDVVTYDAAAADLVPIFAQADVAAAYRGIVRKFILWNFAYQHGTARTGIGQLA